jgi:hypothetical protein
MTLTDRDDSPPRASGVIWKSRQTQRPRTPVHSLLVLPSRADRCARRQPRVERSRLARERKSLCNITRPGRRGRYERCSQPRPPRDAHRPKANQRNNTSGRHIVSDPQGPRDATDQPRRLPKVSSRHSTTGTRFRAARTCFRDRGPRVHATLASRRLGLHILRRRRRSRIGLWRVSCLRPTRPRSERRGALDRY